MTRNVVDTETDDLVPTWAVRRSSAGTTSTPSLRMLALIRAHWPSTAVLPRKPTVTRTAPETGAVNAAVMVGPTVSVTASTQVVLAQ